MVNTKALISTAGGFAGGIALKAVWEKAKLPGYKAIVGPMGQTIWKYPNGQTETVYLGVDDLAQILIDVGVAAGGFATKHPTIGYAGLGLGLGWLITKSSEYFIRGGFLQARGVAFNAPDTTPQYIPHIPDRGVRPGVRSYAG